MKYRTLQEWNRLGRRVRRGSKATWHDNQAHFAENQTDPAPARSAPAPARRSSRGIDERPIPYRSPDRMPDDAGTTVCDNAGREIGTRGYTKFYGSEWVPVTHYPDGSGVTHCGGPCGPLYFDEFGNT